MSIPNIPLGPVMVDVQGFALTEEERHRLIHPLVGGVILFSRNFQSPQQIAELCNAIKQLRTPALLIAVDHEGGRVQRFREGFTRIPPMQAVGEVYDQSADDGLALATEIGWIIGSELAAYGIDFSFTPVLDVNHQRSGVIGNRSLHQNPAIITLLARALTEGLQQAGMSAVGKHFPGHGYVEADSHHAIPVDERSLAQIEQADLVPFRSLAQHGMAAVMPAHVVYPQVDQQPAGYSAIWLQQILRQALQFDGVIFSDDLCMEGAAGAGSITARAELAFQAGCDMVLVCNQPALADELLHTLARTPDKQSHTRLERMRAQPRLSLQQLQQDARWMVAHQKITALSQKLAGMDSGITVGEAPPPCA
ncbi:beta-N-acetylhexosaminidase [Parachitinimonas caeni]|uniref:Beta-hexosaminidase n=1 Tax=Parachitinimonas caeni TaxID=3031301 RepID=A0ABT7E005_9NEIS|nr:beta-N-acetylhexosaminidase [Parachitinimonas caeni]MDK2124242.1 beta-N-acetylhexosaminidase [Parachitinimonas caeni]